MQLHFRESNPSEKALSSGIFVSMSLVIFCIAVLLALAYISLAKTNAENVKQQYAQSGINEKTNQSMWTGISSWWIDTGDHSQTGNIDMEKKIRTIKQASEAQLTTRQIENTNPNFAPEQIIPRYFKSFNGDLSIMRAKR